MTQYIIKKLKRYWLISQYIFRKLIHTVKTKYPSLSKFYTDHFPSVQIGQKLDAWDYSVSFSSEILVIVIVVVAAGVNVFVFNPFSKGFQNKDNSLAAQLLSNHSSMNPQLANKQNTISTKVASGSIFSQAAADYNSVLATSDTATTLPEEAQVDDSGITKPNPDSIQSLVARQVKIYETQPFDTVYTVAAKFNVTPKTIRETNSLPDNALKAGWQLIIPPVDGIVIQVTDPNLTLSDVAKTYSADITKIVSYNGLEDSEDMVDIGGYLIIPGGTLPKPKTPTAPAPTPKKFAPYVPRAASVSGNHTFSGGYCTDYVARKVPGITWGGNANRWIPNARAQGAKVDKNPVAGAILVTNESRRYGHVAYIEKVEGDTIYISEWNYAGLYKTTYRTFDADDSRIQGIIHP